jgi:hypothetical protein
MDPNTTIKLWLLAVGDEYDIHQAHEYRWPDASTVPQVPYFTFRQVSARFLQDRGAQNLSTVDASKTVTHRYSREAEQTYRIDLYRSEDGLMELMEAAIAAEKMPSIMAIFEAGGCSFAGAINFTDETTFDDSEIDYRHSMTCRFCVNPEFTKDETNGSVDQVDLTLEAGATTHEITRSGIAQT